AEAALALLLGATQLLARRLPELALSRLRARLRLADLVLGRSQRAAGLLELGGELGLPLPGPALGLLSRLPALRLDPLLRALLGFALDPLGPAAEPFGRVVARRPLLAAQPLDLLTQLGDLPAGLLLDA